MIYVVSLATVVRLLSLDPGCVVRTFGTAAVVLMFPRPNLDTSVAACLSVCSVYYHFARMIPNIPRVLGILFFLCALPLAWAQFNFFEQMFGQGPGPQHQQRRPSSHSQWAAQADAGECGRERAKLTRS